MKDINPDDLVARGSGDKLVRTCLSDVGWPEGEPGSDEFVDRVIGMIKEELKDSLGVDGVFLEVPPRKFGDDLNFVRFVVRACLDEWINRCAIVICILGRNGRSLRFGFGLQRDGDYWKNRRVRASAKGTPMVWKPDDYFREVVEAIWGSGDGRGGRNDSGDSGN